MSTTFPFIQSSPILLVKEPGSLAAEPGFNTKLNVGGSLGLNFDCDGGPIIENGGPIFLYKSRILEVSTYLREGI